MKQNFLPPTTAWRFTKIKYAVLKNTQVVIRSDPHTGKWIKKYIELAIIFEVFLIADWYLSKHCRLAIFSWASVIILGFLDFDALATFVLNFPFREESSALYDLARHMPIQPSYF